MSSPNTNLQKESYTKTPLTADEQVQLLKARGLSITNESKAKELLLNINYYRLRAYFIPFEENHTTQKFNPDTALDDIIHLYNFDTELRILLSRAIEIIEISLRTKLAYKLAHTYGTHPHLDKSLFSNTHKYAILKKKIVDATTNSSEVFIRHFIHKYKEDLPPIWAIVEIMSLGEVSHMLSNIKDTNIKKQIAGEYGLPSVNILITFLKNITILRNHCAHHSRVWNRAFVHKFKLPKQDGTEFAESLHSGGNPIKLYNYIIFITHVLQSNDIKNTFRDDLNELILKYNIDTVGMGFPPSNK